MAVFLSDEWFNEVDRLTEEAGNLNASPSLANMQMNLNVTESTNGNVEAHLADGILKKGYVDADTTVIIDESTLKNVLFDGNMNKAMEAFMSGKIRIEGDMSQMMALQSVKPSIEQKELFKKIYAMTDHA